MLSLMDNMLVIAKPSIMCSVPRVAAELGRRVALETCGWHSSLSPERLLPLTVGFHTEDRILPCVRKSTIKTARQLSSSLFFECRLMPEPIYFVLVFLLNL